MFDADSGHRVTVARSGHVWIFLQQTPSIPKDRHNYFPHMCIGRGIEASSQAHKGGGDPRCYVSCIVRGLVFWVRGEGGLHDKSSFYCVVRKIVD